MEKNSNILSVETNNNSSSNPPSIRYWFRQQTPLIVILLLVSSLILVFFWNRIVITVEPGEAAVLFKRFTGTKLDKVYAEGLHIFNPIDNVYIYEVRKQVAFHEFSVISNKGLDIYLSLAVRYRPEYDLLATLHQEIGPDYLGRVVLPQIESVIRKQLGNYSAEEIYTNKEGLLTKAILSALDEVGRNYVDVEDIIIRSIILPPEIIKAIEDKLKQEEFMKSYEFRKITAAEEAERMGIEADGIKNYNLTIEQSLTDSILKQKGIEATQDLAKSTNAKVVIIGSGKDGLPIILNTDSDTHPAPQRQQEVQGDETGNRFTRPEQVEANPMNNMNTPR